MSGFLFETASRRLDEGHVTGEGFLLEVTVANVMFLEVQVYRPAPSFILEMKKMRTNPFINNVKNVIYVV